MAMFNNPDMMKAAMEQFQRMSPEQKNSMMATMKGMDPEMIKSMTAQFAPNLSSEQVRQMQQQMTPEAMDQMRPEQYNQQAAYMLAGAKQLKEEGNGLHRSGAHTAALEKYNQACTNLMGVFQPEAVALVKACKLNIAACHLKLKQYAAVEATCTEVIGTDKGSLKAFYRRGLARENLGKLSQALADLRECARINPEEGSVKDAIARITPQLPEDAVAAPLDGPSTEEASAAAVTTPNTAATQSSSTRSAMARASLRASQKLAASDPDSFRAQQQAVLRQTDEELAPIAAATGLSPAGIKARAHAMSNLSDEEIAQMAAEMQNTEMTPQMEDLMMQQMQNPAMREMTRKRMQDPAMAEMLKQQTGMDVSPAQLSAMGQMFENMPPDQMAEMMEMSMKMRSSMAPGTGSGAAATTPSMTATAGQAAMPTSPLGMAANPEMMSQAREMMKNPEMVKAMGSMIESMDEGTLNMMSQQTGMKISPEMAKEMGKKIKEMKPETMEALVTWGERLQRLFLLCLALWRRCFGTWWRMAISVLVLAVVLGHFFGLV